MWKIKMMANEKSFLMNKIFCIESNLSFPYNYMKERYIYHEMLTENPTSELTFSHLNL